MVEGPDDIRESDTVEDYNNHEFNQDEAQREPEQPQLIPPTTTTTTTPHRLVVKLDPRKATQSPMPVSTRILGVDEYDEELNDGELDGVAEAEDADGVAYGDDAALAAQLAANETRYPTRRATRRQSSVAAQSKGSSKKASEEEDEEDEHPIRSIAVTQTRSLRGRTVTRPVNYGEDSEGSSGRGGKRNTRGGGGGGGGSKKRKAEDEFIAKDEEEIDPDAGWGQRMTRSKSKPLAPPPAKKKRTAAQQPLTQSHKPKPRMTRTSMRAAGDSDESFHTSDGVSGGSGSGSARLEDDAVGSPDLAQELEDDEDEDMEQDEDALLEDLENLGEEEQEKRGYALRARKAVNYAIPTLPSHEEYVMEKDKRAAAAASKGKGKNGAVPKKNKLAWNITGKDLSTALGIPVDDSDDDGIGNTPRKPSAFPGMNANTGGGSMFSAGGGLPADIAAGGTPSNFGKVSGDHALADADPLGVNTNITFDAVGGLDDHIKQLKEMVSLPLLYPELFQKFNVTPPRGVLFHGPPGTGKTLLARALAASCSNGETKISFFMRKGADCLSKWVGEAERQLRLLFEEAKACQPSIIFFDEIDGLAPVRSSKQDQIHASIVSTLLALMDGMDGRGQVIVIGATNRPDAVDPALRRPGRFDREFYFPLPNIEARRKIIDIHTKGWEPELEDAFKDNLAEVTKGYGGADLRALCTEAALNAIQRRYPQIYKTNDRLQLKADTISVQARDFMVSVQNIVPSSERSAASAAATLPPQLVPLLSAALEKAKSVLDRALPPNKKRSVLEEAEWESEDPMDGSFDRELMMQSMETQRVYRPRVLIHGPVGMGQNFIGAAALHHLEGFNVQSLDLGSLLSDSTRTPEAAVVQMFVEAKRHKPSIVFIPQLVGWANAVTETTRSTVKAMLDSLSPSDPVLLMAIVDGPLKDLPKNVRTWFGYGTDNRIALTKPTAEQRAAFFTDLVEHVARPPSDFPDGMPRKRRVLEVLPVAPPPPPREPTEAELRLQAESDARLKEYLKWRLGPVLSDLKRKFKKFSKSAVDEYGLPNDYFDNPPAENPLAPETGPSGTSHGDAIVLDGEEQPIVNGHVSPPPPGPEARFHNVDLEKINGKLYYDTYLTPQQFMDDIALIVANAELDQSDTDRLWKAKQLQVTAGILLDQCCDAQFRLECERAAQREKKRVEGLTKATKPKVNGTTAYAPGTRQSARVNGKPPEFSVTDLALVEKRKKRERGEETSGSGGASGSDGRAAKRAKMAHFVDGEEPRLEDPPVDGGAAAVAAGPDLIMRMIESGEITASGGSAPTAGGTASASAPASAPGWVPEPPAVPAPQLVTADPFTSSDPFAFPRDPTPVGPHAHPDLLQVMPPQAEGSSLLAVHGSVYPQRSAPMEIVEPTSPTIGFHSIASIPNELIADPTAAAPSPIPARSPTPQPRPVFHLDASLHAQLKARFTDRTGELNVEQLEQLRAMELDLVWRRRKDWDRDELAREMLEMAERFVREVLDEEEEEL